IQQRWLVVFSQAAQMRELKTLEKAQAKELDRAQKEWRKLEGQNFNCQADAEKALEQFNRKWKVHLANAKAVAVMLSIAAPCIPVIAALMCTTKRSVEGVRILILLGLQEMIYLRQIPFCGCAGGSSRRG
ncbi:MAG TPA: hypothetical protein VLM83_11980, partial [Anaerolineales bacterium]|nr:hypothetical protein [Anaerolineales bacterium]